jgi:hypothetical protein
MKRLHLLLSGLSFLAASVAFSQAAPNLGHTVVGPWFPTHSAQNAERMGHGNLWHGSENTIKNDKEL